MPFVICVRVSFYGCAVVSLVSFVPSCRWFVVQLCLCVVVSLCFMFCFFRVCVVVSLRFSVSLSLCVFCVVASLCLCCAGLSLCHCVVVSLCLCVFVSLCRCAYCVYLCVCT